jgi:hypothetical protein
MSLPTLAEFLAVRVRHKKEGWTGVTTVEDCHGRYNSSHAMGMSVTLRIQQDTHDENGKYVEDPWVDDLEELEVLL